MAFIELTQAGVEIPIYNANTRSLKNRLIQVASGGKLGADKQGTVVVHALSNLSFSICDGERVGIIGDNGSGKSTLLRLLSKVYEPSSGKASIKGEVGSLIDISLGIDPEATGRENIYIRAALLGISKAEITKNIENVINFSELGNFIDMPVRTYSSGMHLRLAFSVSTIRCPEILLMDEWLSVGDNSFKLKSEIRLLELVKATNILVIASHSKNLLLQVCNRVIWLKNGKICMDGKTNLVCNTYFKYDSLVKNISEQF